ncbi:hypothetical protein [Helicobacter sp. T3_23-1056]
MTIRETLRFLQNRSMTANIPSLRESRLLLKRLDSWQSITKKSQKSVIWQFVIVDCHASLTTCSQ